MRANGTNAAESAQSRAGFRSAFASRAFTLLFAAEVQSIVGDQLARVALSILVFRETQSATATGLTYATTYVPAIVGGAVLGGVGDRVSRRTVMVACDLARALLFAAMSAAGLPLPVVVVLLAVAVFLGPTFTGAEVAYLAAALPPERFRVATGLRMIAGQGGQVLGFALGGVAVQVLGPRPALLVDAATFAVSAAVVGFGLPARPAARHPRRGADVPEAPSGYDGLWRTPDLRALIALSLLAGFFVVPEGLAVPFGSAIGASTAATGVLLGAIPLGGAVGAILLIRLVPPGRRARIAQAMAVACGVPLVFTALMPGVLAAAVLWLISGVLAAYQVEVATAIVQAIPDAARARAVSRLGSLLIGSQGLGLVVFAAAANLVSAGAAIALAGGVGSTLALALVLGPLRSSSSSKVGRE